MVLVLLETAAGYGLFKVEKPGLLTVPPEQVVESFTSAGSAAKAVSLQAFTKFKSTQNAVDDALALMESRLGKGLKKFLKKQVKGQLSVGEQLIVADRALGSLIQKKFDLPFIHTDNTKEILRGIRAYASELISTLSEADSRAMSLSLSHSLNRFKLKFSPEKVDIMVIQAVGLLDDLDKELNNFAMSLKEWYGWHFPELPKIVTDNAVFARVVKVCGMRNTVRSAGAALAELVPEDVDKEIKMAAEISMGTEMTEEDLAVVTELADRVIELSQYRASLCTYLRTRMEAIAPNLTHMVGELIGARLISHAGSLMSLAKHPASTVQILGAEKALFRALKAKQATPKYGLLFHAHIIGQSAPKLKGKMSRVLAAKLALCSRVDALGDQDGPTVAVATKQFVERRLEQLQSDTVAHGIGHSVHRPRMHAPYQPPVIRDKNTRDTEELAEFVPKAKKVKTEENGLAE